MSKKNVNLEKSQDQVPNNDMGELANMESFEEHMVKVSNENEDKKIADYITKIQDQKKKDITTAVLGSKSAFLGSRVGDVVLSAILDYDEGSGESASEYLKRYAAIYYENRPDFEEKQGEYTAILSAAEIMPKIEIGYAISGAKETPGLADNLFSERLFVPNANNRQNKMIRRPDSERQVIRYLSNKYRHDVSTNSVNNDKYISECNQKIVMLSDYFRGNSFESQMLNNVDDLDRATRSQRNGLNYMDGNVTDIIKRLLYCRELQKEVEMDRNIYEAFLKLLQQGQQILEKTNKRNNFR